MKNIHILPTEKPSRLVKQKYDTIDRLCLADMATKRVEYKRFNLYITNSEEIKIDEYYIHGNRLHKHLGKKCLDVLTNKEYPQSNLINKDSVFKKVILSTDLELQKDGVQAIDDEFLEWFVKNPSCESVEVRKIGKEWTYNAEVPKEEPNPFELPKTLSDDVFYESLEPKQETIEEVAERFSNTYAGDEVAPAYEGFIDGAKWQQERMLKFILDEDNYTEEELESSCIDVQTLVHFIEQFKKK